MIKDKLNWDEGKEVIATSGRRPTFAITSNGYGRINKSFRIKYHLNNIKCVKIKYNKTENRIIVGFMFLSDKEENSFPIYIDERGGASFSVRSLMSELNINYKEFKAKKFIPDVQQNEENKIFVIELQKKEDEDG